MDSIERMRRINDLTKELKQRGFAESSFEAIKQANQIYGSDDLDDHVKHGIIQNSPHERMTKEDTMGDDSIPFSDRKTAKLSENVDVLTNKMNEIIRAINDLDGRLADIKSKQDKMLITLNARPEPRLEPKTESKVEHVEAKQEQPHESSPAAVKDEYSINQRTGNFQSQDVAIDKMFYYGNKK